VPDGNRQPVFERHPNPMSAALLPVLAPRVIKQDLAH
jgi:hypothetical protein